jgi:hypothetical protein
LQVHAARGGEQVAGHHRQRGGHILRTFGAAARGDGDVIGQGQRLARLIRIGGQRRGRGQNMPVAEAARKNADFNARHGSVFP